MVQSVSMIAPLVITVLVKDCLKQYVPKDSTVLKAPLLVYHVLQVTLALKILKCILIATNA